MSVQSVVRCKYFCLFSLKNCFSFVLWTSGPVYLLMNLTSPAGILQDFLKGIGDLFLLVCVTCGCLQVKHQPRGNSSVSCSLPFSVMSLRTLSAPITLHSTVQTSRRKHNMEMTHNINFRLQQTLQWYKNKKKLTDVPSSLIL